VPRSEEPRESESRARPGIQFTQLASSATLSHGTTRLMDSTVLLSFDADAMDDIGTTETVIRVLAAIIAGACIGWERESSRKPAGLRTHMLVSLGAAATILASLELHHELIAHGNAGSSDLMKAIAGIIGGVGFLGAGSIIRDSTGVRGLTTAATIWLSAAIGVASGLGYYTLAVTCVIAALTILILLGLLEQHVLRTFGIRKESEEPDERPQ
jgi:putative Mg2+ transporter-C (MgtC) family protein